MLAPVVFAAVVVLSSLAYADAPYANGETIRYNITQMGMKVGEASLVFQGPAAMRGKDTLLVVFTSKGFNFYDRENIYLDPQTFRPLFVERDIDIFGKKEKIFEEYAGGKIKISKDAGGKKSEQVLEKGDVDNIYGFIYRYRQQGSFKQGDMADLHLPTKDVNIKLLRQVKLAAAGKKFDSFYMESVPAQYKLWFDAGPKKLPLRISGSVGPANTAMVMKDYKE